MKFIGSKRGLILIILGLLIVGVISFSYYVSDYYHADNIALGALSSTENYTVMNTDDSITFTPTANNSSTGVILYPGAKVQAESYSVLASELAKNGYTTIIVKMPFNLAFFGVNRADKVISQHGEIDYLGNRRSFTWWCFCIGLRC